MFNEFLHKDVRIRQADGFLKIGFVEKIENGFLFVRFYNGKLIGVFEKEIASIEEITRQHDMKEGDDYGG